MLAGLRLDRFIGGDNEENEIETGGSFVRPLRDLFARRAKRIRR